MIYPQERGSVLRCGRVTVSFKLGIIVKLLVEEPSRSQTSFNRVNFA